MKRFLTFILATSIFATTAYGEVDNLIFSSQNPNFFTGKEQGIPLSKGLNFTDIANHEYSDNIAQLGALSIIDATGGAFYPDSSITRFDALKLFVHMLGLKDSAREKGFLQNGVLPDEATSSDFVNIGYLEEARDQGLIDQETYDNGLEYFNSLDITEPLMREALELYDGNLVASREEIAKWLVDTVTLLDPTYFDDVAPVDPLDITHVNSDYLSNVNNVLGKNIMHTTDNLFHPNGAISKGEVVNLISKVIDAYLTKNNLTRKNGVVSGERENIEVVNTYTTTFNDVYVRNTQGLVDVLRKQSVLENDLSDTDVVVFKNGVTTLDALEGSDSIEYITDQNDNALFVNVVDHSPSRNLTGKLQQVDPDNNTITVIDGYSHLQLPVADGLIFEEDGKDFLTVDNENIDIDLLPYGDSISLAISNDVIRDVSHLGQPVVVNEFRGIVTENSPNFGYVIVLKNDGTKETLNYPKNLQVKKRKHYMENDFSGDIDYAFPNFSYDPRDTTMEDIEVGDIIFIQRDSDDRSVIDDATATADYSAKYGKITSFNLTDGIADLFLEQENGLISNYKIPQNIFVTKDGFTIPMTQVIVGDYAKILVNEAILEPGHITESVKEIAIESQGQDITSIAKGQLVSIDKLQNTVLLKNPSVLGKNGWETGELIGSYDIGKDTTFYFNGDKIDRDFADRYLTKSDVEGYLVTQDYLMGESIKQISIYSGRDKLIEESYINESAGGHLVVGDNSLSVSTDDSTIVIKDDKLVHPSNIYAKDYAQIAVNGGNKAALVNIKDHPNSHEYSVIRARVKTFDEGNSFTVGSLAVLEGDTWEATPITREFIINDSTLFINGAGDFELPEKIVPDETYTIIAKGADALFVYDDSPYIRDYVRGTIVDYTDDTLTLEEVSFGSHETSHDDFLRSYDQIKVTIPPNVVNIKNEVRPIEEIFVDDKVLIMTDFNTSNLTKDETIEGHIIINEK